MVAVSASRQSSAQLKTIAAVPTDGSDRLCCSRRWSEGHRRNSRGRVKDEARYSTLVGGSRCGASPAGQLQGVPASNFWMHGSPLGPDKWPSPPLGLRGGRSNMLRTTCPAVALLRSGTFRLSAGHAENHHGMPPRTRTPPGCVIGIVEIPANSWNFPTEGRAGLVVARMRRQRPWMAIFA